MKRTLTLITLLLLVPLAGLHAADRTPRPAGEQPQVQADCNGVPIKRFGFCWVLGEAPDLLDDVPLQAGNNTPRVDVHLKSPCRKAVAYDPLNGVSQELSITRSGEATLFKGVLVRDWPLVVRFSDR